ncbi:MAG: winged helix-turn-helix transcriptional regulator [Candidatus Eisenbacteria bacterium]|uniref:Winged helix-turn-helix transcriptional regulator n=1 Tax=Eiseniibacteriota bacterium TaxID=2212470 RepID=A0A7Y2H1S0_UNCEI|nr:winged helix-turn-helix transcriptional regulator [Candidatus Eisenbacteria bacterium]
MAEEFFSEEFVKRGSKILKILSDESRLRIMLYLAKDGESPVGKLVDQLGIPQPRVSHHLGILRGADLVKDRREGRQIIYDINDPLWRELGLEFFEKLKKGDRISILGRFMISRVQDRLE